MRKTIRSLSFLSLILSLFWFAYYPGFEPAITALLGMVGLLASFRDNENPQSIIGISNKNRKTILYIDDDLIKIRFQMLEDLGYKVVPATDADIALKEVKRLKFDLIILDIMMKAPRFVKKEEVRGGYETGIYIARKIKEGKNIKTPIIVVTAKPLPEVEKDLQSIGIISYLRKPISQNDLVDEINKLLLSS